MNERPSNEFKVHVVTLDEAVRRSLHAILGGTLRLTKNLFLEDAHHMKPEICFMCTRK